MYSVCNLSVMFLPILYSALVFTTQGMSAIELPVVVPKKFPVMKITSKCGYSRPRILTQYCVSKTKRLPLVQVGTDFYFFGTKVPTSWYYAQKFCRSIGLKLGEPKSSAEEYELSAYMLGRGEFWSSRQGAYNPGRGYVSSESGLALYNLRLANTSRSSRTNCLAIYRSDGKDEAEWRESDCEAAKSFFCELPNACYVEQCFCSCTESTCPDFNCMLKEASLCCKYIPREMFASVDSKTCSHPRISSEERTLVLQNFVAFTPRVVGTAGNQSYSNGTLVSLANSGYSFKKLLWFADCLFRNFNLMEKAGDDRVNPGAFTQYLIKKVMKTPDQLVQRNINESMALCLTKLTESYSVDSFLPFEGSNMISTHPFQILMCIRKQLFLACPKIHRIGDPMKCKMFNKELIRMPPLTVTEDVMRKKMFPPKGISPPKGIVPPFGIAKGLRLEAENGSKSYFIFRDSTYSFAGCVGICKQRMMRVLSLETKDKEDFLESHIGNSTLDKQGYKEVFWLGGGCEVEDKVFVWAFIGVPFARTYQNWLPGTGPKAGGDQDPTWGNWRDPGKCTMMARFPPDQRLRWVDVKCDFKMNCICED